MGRTKGRGDEPAGTLVRRTHKDGPQIIRDDGKRWGPAAEKRFLDCLAASCNVKLSAVQSGFSAVTAYNRRRADAAFAARWQAALEQGYVRLETALLRAAADAMEGFAPDVDAPIPTVTVKEALQVLGMHRAAATRGVRARGRWARPRSLEELSDGILAKLSVIEAVRERS
ncbi:hypothetical protein [uncultured Sphingomonas sp.]|uniref:hypothetical protein n=1 Tax=uncultured Sphingomonas sp. TaxID=158754 RepID=UPI0035CAE966